MPSKKKKTKQEKHSGAENSRCAVLTCHNAHGSKCFLLLHLLLLWQRDTIRLKGTLKQLYRFGPKTARCAQRAMPSRPTDQRSNGYRFSHADEVPFGRDFTNSNQKNLHTPSQVSSKYTTHNAYFFSPLTTLLLLLFLLPHFTSFLDCRCDSGGPHHKRFELASNNGGGTRE